MRNNIKDTKTPRDQVLEYYSNSEVYKNDRTGWYTIVHETSILGKGPSLKAAWKSASRNING